MQNKKNFDEKKIKKIAAFFKKEKKICGEILEKKFKIEKNLAEKICENFFKKTQQLKFLMQKVEQKFCSRKFEKIKN